MKKKFWILSEIITIVLVVVGIALLVVFVKNNQNEDKQVAENIEITANAETLFETENQSSINQVEETQSEDTTMEVVNVETTTNSSENIIPVKVEENIKVEPIPVEEIEKDTNKKVAVKIIMDDFLPLQTFMRLGVIQWNDYIFTYYSQSKLPGNNLKIPGRQVNELGYVVDEEGYIVLANNAPVGTIIETPFGAKGKVYDRGVLVTDSNHFDVYVK